MRRVLLLCVLLLVAKGISFGQIFGRLDGRALDASTGLPLERSTLTLQSLGDTPNLTSQSDANGVFRFDSIPLGDYYLLGAREGFISQRLSDSPNQPLTVIEVHDDRRFEVTILLSPAARLSGIIYDIDRQPVAGATVELIEAGYSGFGERLMRRVSDVRPTETDTEGVYSLDGIAPGDYFIRSYYSARSESGVLTGAVTTTYYPGVQNLNQAAAITIPLGVDLVSRDFTLATEFSRRIVGRIVNPFAQEREGAGVYNFYLAPRDNQRFRETARSLSDFDPAPETFELRDVPIGSYYLYVSFGVPRPPDPWIYASRDVIDIFADDLVDLTVTIRDGVDLKGRIELDEAARQMLETTKGVGEIIPLFTTLDGMPGILSPTAFAARLEDGLVESDGTFLIPNIIRARYFLTVVPPKGLVLSAARLGTQDVLGQPIEIHDNTGPLVLQVSGNGGQVSGLVTDQNQVPILGAQVVLVPPIHLRNDQTAYSTVRTDRNGGYSLTGVRPARYDVFAFQEIEDRAWLNTEFLGPYLNFGTPLNIRPGDTRRLDLEVILPR